MKIDYAKRRRVMERSRALGHCICDPRRPCPCDVLTGQGFCPCAGERPDPEPIESIRLTGLVRNAGCASKIAPRDLANLLDRLPPVEDPAVIVGLPAADDAGIYQITPGTRLVQTVDVMTPCVDDAEMFGRICAANCLSDVYAMGGVPRTALSVIGFPSERLTGEIMYLMLKGAMAVFEEAGVALIGGHSIKDEEIKLGFAITGTIGAKAVCHGSAAPGDVLVLTKPLGVGVINFCAQIGRAEDASTRAAAACMASLNRAAAEAMVEAGASACTDITGFGLFGHLVEMMRHAGATARVSAASLPALPGALEAIRADVIPGAMERNREFVGDDLAVDDGVDEALVNLGFDAQTSGGLLIAAPGERLAPLLEGLRRRGVEGFTVGRVIAGGPHARRIVVTADEHDAPAGAGAAHKVGADGPAHTGPDPAAASAAAHPGAADDGVCCAEYFGHGEPPATATSTDAPAATPPGAGTSAEALRAFGGLMRATGASGLIDARTKELINFALVLLARCEPCLAAHARKAMKMGISRQELDEVAWCATAMGGAPVRIFYEEGMKAAE